MALPEPTTPPAPTMGSSAPPETPRTPERAPGRRVRTLRRGRDVPVSDLGDVAVEPCPTTFEDDAEPHAGLPDAGLGGIECLSMPIASPSIVIHPRHPTRDRPA